VLEAVRATGRGGMRFEPHTELERVYARRYAVYRVLQDDLRRAWRIAASESRAG
jgi:hypothetical protein